MAGQYNIRIQYAAWIAVVTVGTVVVLTGLHMWRAVDDQEEAAHWLGQHEARELARAIAPSVVSTNVNMLIRVAGQSVNDEDVLYLRVLDAKDNVLFRPPQNHDPAKLVITVEPISSGGRRIGTIEMGVGRRRMADRLWGAFLWDAGVGVVLVVIFVGGSVLITMPVQESLRSLLEYVQRVAKGEQQDEPLTSDLAEVDAVARELKALMARVEDARHR